MAFTCGFSNGFSNGFAICVAGPTETLSYINPPQACVGAVAFALTVTGTGFTGAANVRVNGASRVTVFVSATQLIATIPAGDLAVPGLLAVTVVDGATTVGPNYLTVAVCPVVASGHGPHSHPEFDHLADVRASDNQLNKLQDAIATDTVLRRVTRQ